MAALDETGLSARGVTPVGDSAQGENLEADLSPPLGVFGLGVEGESSCDPVPRPPLGRFVMRYLTPEWNLLSTVPPRWVSSYSIWSILL